MSGIAELLANLGYGVSGSDEKRSAVTERLTTLGIRVAYGHRAGERRRCRRRGDVLGGPAGEPRGSRGGAAADSGDPAGRDARGADAAALRDCRRRVAREDDDDVDDCVRARTRRTRSDGGHRRTGQRLRQQRAAGQRRVHGGRSGRKRSDISQVVSDDCGDDEHRPRTPRELRRVRRPAAGVRRLCQPRAVLRLGDRVRRQPAAGGGVATHHATCDHVRPLRNGCRFHGDRHLVRADGHDRDRETERATRRQPGRSRRRRWGR